MTLGSGRSAGATGIDAVVFDWGGTLTPWSAMDPAVGWSRYAAAAHPDDPERAAGLAATLADADLAHWVRVKHTARAFGIGDVLAAAGVDTATDGHVAGLAAYRDYWTPSTHTRPEAAAVLGALRGRGLRIGVLSSTMWPGDWHEDWLRRDGVLDAFNARVWSSDLIWTKPRTEAFRAVLDALGVDDPSRAVYVGDRPYDDVTGAHRAGMHTVFVPHSDIPVAQQVATDVTPDAVAHELTDIPDLIAAW